VSSASDGQFVTLGLGAEVFAVPVAYVREILDYPLRSAFPMVRPICWA
jgi:purine-binding chemotaxis protein CheW